MKRSQKTFYIGASIFIAFIIWTVLVRFVDIKAIGPQESSVGFATLNAFFHNHTGVHMSLYNITDWLSFIPFATVFCFALLGLIQWFKRKSIKQVDFDIFVLGGFYVVVLAIFFLFEKIFINYRPILIEGVLEASYPSSTTMLVMCVMPTAILQLNNRIKNITLRRFAIFLIAAFSAFMVVGRLISGVHWLTDIIGGALLSAGLVTMYYSISTQRSNNIE